MSDTAKWGFAPLPAGQAPSTASGLRAGGRRTGSWGRHLSRAPSGVGSTGEKRRHSGPSLLGAVAVTNSCLPASPKYRASDGGRGCGPAVASWAQLGGSLVRPSSLLCPPSAVGRAEGFAGLAWILFHLGDSAGTSGPAWLCSAPITVPQLPGLTGGVGKCGARRQCPGLGRSKSQAGPDSRVGDT